MRASRHNGRFGKNGVYNPKHNDREFDLDKADNIDPTMTPYNVYWNCVDRVATQHKDRGDNWHSFTEVEENFYDLVYKDYLEGQNARHLESRHKERCRTMDDIRNNKLTCPEETVYQIGNIDGTVEFGELLKITAEFFSTIQERYGEHVHILNWALHLDEGTPHIHERHVFDVINQYGERQPKQEQALKELGFELPDPSKKSGKFNNRKMSYDAECRKLFIEICHKHGIEIEVEPIYGGVQYLEKKEYIIKKLNANYEELQSKFQKLNLLYENAKAENERLLAMNEKLELKIEDVEGLLHEVTCSVYDKACDVLVEEIADKARDEDMAMISKYKKWIESNQCKEPRLVKKTLAKHFDSLGDYIQQIGSKVITRIKDALMNPEKKAKLINQIKEKARPSTMGILKKNHLLVEQRKITRTKKHNECEVER